MSDNIILEVVKSEGLAHHSYLIGEGTDAAVIDPRRDCDTYLDLAQANQLQIRHIFETHRNEDYVSGAVELARRTHAPIFHGKSLPFSYGNPVNENDEFKMGKLMLRVLETPGHTLESISLVLYDLESADGPVAVFTGDLLFIGATGRTDLIKGRERELAEKQYHSIFKKILPLGDHVILYPAHGAGSVCGAGMAKRDFSTLGYERLYSKPLQAKTREEFIAAKLAEHPMQPPYFSKMEEYNQHGNAPLLDRVSSPEWWSVEQLKRALDNGIILLDVRPPESIAGAYIKGSLTIPLALLPAYAGFFLPYGSEIALVADTPEQYTTAVMHLRRLGFDAVRAFLAGGMKTWETAGEPFDHLDSITVHELIDQLEHPGESTLVDVRKEEEIQSSGKLPGSTHVFLGDILQQSSSLPKKQKLITFCGSGQRAVIAATLLKNQGFNNVVVNFGSMAACKSAGCPVEDEMPA